MPPHVRGRRLLPSLLALAAGVLLATGCTSSLTTNTTSDAKTGPAFVVGTDAPMAAVTSFSVQIQSVMLTDSSGNTASLISGTPTVDFARFNGLQTLLDMNDIPAGTYTGVTINLGPATIGYLDNTTTPPSITTEAATLTTNSVSLTLNNPLVVTTGGAPAGLRMDFDLQKSIGVDTNGNITGTVTPTFHVRAVANSDEGGHIDEMIASVVQVPSGTTEPASFMVQGPHGEQFTINTTSTTEWDNNSSLSDLTTSSIVLIAGQLDRADQTLDADEIVILSQNGFYAGGQVTYVTPATGDATSLDLYVRSVLPASTGVQLGDIATVNLTGGETYSIYRMHNTFTDFFFNQSSLIAGQHVAIGGPASGAASESAVTVNHVALLNWGFNGTIVGGSQDSGKGSFQMQVNGFAGQLIPQTVTVYLGDACDFRYGLGAFANLANGANIRVVGLLLKDPTTGNPVLLARHIDGLSFTDMTVTAWQ
ncbi:MAG TPA: DUF4382 domain-containing protein [Terracidiphilus sp.]|nr:DUF4382 domain-containing protein [Terracidiphilus sp.]